MSQLSMCQPEPFGRDASGRQASLFTLQNERLRVRITDFGGRMVSIEAPDRDGRREHVLLGFSSVAEYASAGGSFGGLLGRTANRIAGGCFVLEGKRYELSKNEPAATLHGGARGFDRTFWQVVAGADAGAARLGEGATRLSEGAMRLILAYSSPDGDQGFPGALDTTAIYELDGATLSLTFEARASHATPVSLSAHPYFNLAGPAARDMLDHEFTIDANRFLPTDAAQIPTGEIRSVDGTPFDFRHPHTAAERIRDVDEQLRRARGYDHYFVLEPNGDSDGSGRNGHMRRAARVREPRTGRILEIFTTQPGVQFYTGNNLNGSVDGRGGSYRQSAGFAFEPQGFPDAPNQPGFPSTILAAGQVYRQRIEYRFSAQPAGRDARGSGPVI